MEARHVALPAEVQAARRVRLALPILIFGFTSLVIDLPFLATARCRADETIRADPPVATGVQTRLPRRRLAALQTTPVVLSGGTLIDGTGA
ncbi:MAG: hypothetical protein V1750_04595 [Acidobacteriota bacterium]